MKHLKLFENFDSLVLYHGSEKDFSEFTINHKSSSGMAYYGAGIYLTSIFKNATIYSHSNGFVYDVVLLPDSEIVEWDGLLSQDTIDKIVAYALSENIIDKNKLDEINNIDKNIKDDDGSVIGFVDFYDKYGDELSKHRTFTNIDMNDKYPLLFSDLYDDLTDTLFNGSLQETSDFLSMSGIDGVFKNSESDKIYTIYNTSKLVIKNKTKI